MAGLNNLKRLLRLIAVAAAVRIFLKFIAMKLTQRKWRNTALKHGCAFIERVQNQKTPILNISTVLKEQILKSDVTTLLQLLESRKVTSEQILVVYFQRAQTLGLEMNLLTNIMFDSALQQARSCDQVRNVNPSLAKGLMFGIPFSVKDNIDMEGLDSTVGMACRINRPCSSSSLSIELLQQQGAIPFLRSNLPQVALSYASSNFIFGTAQNPWNRERSPGGSSGGEAALVSSHCSPIGIGNDQGGSLRLPASFCGVYTLKPTSGRNTLQGCTVYSQTYKGNTSVPVSNGPMTKSINDINLFMKCQFMSDELQKQKRFDLNADLRLNSRPWDETIVYDQNLNKCIKIGYILHVDMFPSCDTAVRAVQEAVQVLRERGFEVVEIKCPFMEEFIQVFHQLFLAEGQSRQLTEALEGESPIPEYGNLLAISQISNFIKPFLVKILTFLGQKRLSLVLNNSFKLSAEEFFRLRCKQIELTDKLMRMFQDNKIMILLTPAYPCPAFLHTKLKDMGAFFSAFTFMCNIANLPAGVVPITIIQANETLYKPAKEEPNCMVLKAFAENMKGSEGMPMGVQVVGLPWRDEECLAIMREIDNGIQFQGKHGLYFQKDS